VINRYLFEQIERKHGQYASWAVWAEPGIRPKSNVGDITILDPDKNEYLLETLKTNVVMAGLNISRPLTIPFKNFHDDSPFATDYKIRYAFRGTEYYGAYMTDVLKDYVNAKSANVRAELKKNPDVLRPHLKIFREELTDLGANRPVIITFGRDAEQLLRGTLNIKEYSEIIRVTHYSVRISKEKYREEVLAKCN